MEYDKLFRGISAGVKNSGDGKPCPGLEAIRGVFESTSPNILSSYMLAEVEEVISFLLAKLK